MDERRELTRLERFVAEVRLDAAAARFAVFLAVFFAPVLALARLERAGERADLAAVRDRDAVFFAPVFLAAGFLAVRFAAGFLADLFAADFLAAAFVPRFAAAFVVRFAADFAPFLATDFLAVDFLAAAFLVPFFAAFFAVDFFAAAFAPFLAAPRAVLFAAVFRPAFLAVVFFAVVFLVAVFLAPVLRVEALRLRGVFVATGVASPVAGMLPSPSLIVFDLSSVIIDRLLNTGPLRAVAPLCPRQRHYNRPVPNHDEGGK